MTLESMAPALPEIWLAFSVMALMMVGVFTKPAGAHKLVSILACFVLVVAGLLVLYVGGERQVAFGGMFLVDAFAQYMKILVLLGALLTLIIGKRFVLAERMDRFEYPILILFSVTGMLLMISANDLMSLYVGLELQSLALYVIAAFQRDTLRSTEAGLKYFVLGALSSGMLLYGCSMIYGFTGTTSFDGLSAAFDGDTQASLGVVVGIVFLAAGLAFKVSAVPFHMWTPDVYEGAPTPVTAFFAVAPKIAAIALFVRALIGPFGDLVAEWQQIIVLVSIASMLLGSFAAIAQNNIKRLMAYSSIGHIGYALIGLAAGNEEGVSGVLVYMAIYLFMNVGTFACILAMRRNGRGVEQISDLAGLSRHNPLMALALLVFMFSMAGIPPMAGFWSKLYIFIAAVNSGLVPLAIVGALASVVSAFYYLRIIKVMYFDEPAEKFEGTSLGLRIVLSGTALFTLLFILAPAVVLDPASAAAAALFG